MKPPPDRSGWGLSARFVAMSLALLLVVQAAVFLVMQFTMAQGARAQLTQELAVDARVLQRLLDQDAQKLNQAASVLAADFGFRSAVTSADLETIRSVLSNHGARIGATVSAWLDGGLALQAVGEGQDLASLQGVIRQISQPLSRQGVTSQMATVNGMPHQFVMVSVRAPVLVGWVLMGFPLGQRLLDDMHALSGAQIALLNPALPPTQWLLNSTLASLELKQLPASPAESGDLVIAGQRWMGRRLDLPLPQGRLQAWLMRPYDQVLEPLRSTQVALAWITALGVLMFGLASAFVARKVTTPLRRLVREAGKLGQGDYATPVAHTGQRDEIGELATAFDHMRVSIGQQQSEIRHLAYTDRLTGLANRVKFRASLQEAMTGSAGERGSASECCVLLLNLDRFRSVNDVLGYSFGDRVLQAVAARLQDLSHSAGVARTGGDEFALLLDHEGVQSALALAQQLAQSFATPLALEGQLIDLSVSVGIAIFPQHANDPDALLSRAEVAMYTAKRRTTGIQVYETAMESSSHHNLTLLGDLRHAMVQGDLRLYLQPKIALANSEPVAAEALVRWHHAVRGLVPPLEFIPFAEQTGFIRELTLWVFGEACAVWQQLRAGTGEPMRLAVNLSARDLVNPEFPGKLDLILSRHGIPADAFCLEITESAIMDEPERAEATLAALHARGFKLSIDDFGTGYSSLAYLQRLPVEQLKIDKSFVLAMESSASDANIVRSTIELAHNLGLTVVAEGVETAGIYNALKRLGCDEAQGYLIAKPMPADEFTAWRRQWSSQTTANRRDFGQSIPMQLG